MRALRLKLVMAGMLPLQWAFFSQVTQHHEWVERSFSQGVYPKIGITLRRLSGWLPFSVGQLIVLLVMVWLTYIVFKLIRRSIKDPKTTYKSLGRFVLNIAVFSSFVYLAFMLVWGLNYGRSPLLELMELKKPEVETAQLEKLCKTLIAKAKRERKLVTHREDSTLAITGEKHTFFTTASEAYELLNRKQPFIEHKVPSTKSVFVPQTMSLLGIGGIYFPFTGEANINMHPPDFKLPFTICHEMAHQVGFASESEANFIAYMACTHSKDHFFRYSGYFTAMRYALNALWRSDTLAFQKVAGGFSEGIAVDLEANTAYWEQFDTPIDRFSSKVNHLFLKANGQKEGIRSYGMMVDLLLAYQQQKNGI